MSWATLDIEGMHCPFCNPSLAVSHDDNSRGPDEKLSGRWFEPNRRSQSLIDRLTPFLMNPYCAPRRALIAIVIAPYVVL